MSDQSTGRSIPARRSQTGRPDSFNSRKRSATNRASAAAGDKASSSASSGAAFAFTFSFRWLPHRETGEGVGTANPFRRGLQLRPIERTAQGPFIRPPEHFGHLECFLP